MTQYVVAKFGPSHTLSRLYGPYSYTEAMETCGDFQMLESMEKRPRWIYSVESLTNLDVFAEEYPTYRK